MAVTPKGIWTPDNSDQYDLVVDAAATANSIDRAISKTAATLAGLGTGVFTGQWGWVTGGGGVAYQWTGTGWRSREEDDTGWVNISSNLLAGLTGNLSARRQGDTVSLRGIITRNATTPSGSGFTTFTTSLSANLRPTTSLALGTMYAASPFINGVLLARPDGTLAIHPNSSIAPGQSIAVSVTYLA